MGSFVRDFQAHQADDTYERMCGLEPASLDAEHDRHLTRLDRLNDYAPSPTDAALDDNTRGVSSNPGRPHPPADGRDPSGA